MASSVGVVGGGIGGLSTAIALRARGFEVTVFERAERRRSEGIALLLWANAVRALSRLGVDVAPLGAPIERTEIRVKGGDVLCDLPIDAWSRAAGAPSIAIRRPVLLDALSRAVPDEVVQTGKKLVRFERAGRGVLLRFADGSTHAADALVGADGLHSGVRAQLLGDHPVRMVDQRGWVGLARPRSGLLAPGRTTAILGTGPRFWVAPLPEGAAFWFATLGASATPRGDPRVFLREGLADFHGPIAELLEATREDEIIEARICDRPPVDRWGEGPVTLVGDAAHPSTPDLGQGACQAIESAATLAEHLAKASDVEEGLRAYERARMERTATISRMCWITSMNTTLESSLLCAIRDASIRLTLPGIAKRHFPWILGTP